MQSPQLQTFLAHGQIIVISHTFFISFQLHLLDVQALHFHPSLQAFNLFIWISKDNAVCLFLFFFYKLPGCSPFSLLAENIEPFLRMLIILLLFFFYQLHGCSFLSFLAESIEMLLRMLIFFFSFLGSFKYLLKFVFPNSLKWLPLFFCHYFLCNTGSCLLFDKW
jgi:hypothetical protein